MTDLLLINLGMGRTDRDPPYDEVTYVFDDGFEVRTALAGLALWRWLAEAGREPARVAFVATAKAWRERCEFALDEVRRMGGIESSRLDPEPLETRLPASMGDLWGDLDAIASWCARHGEGEAPTLHLDLTHSFRAIPLAQILLLEYLQSRGAVRVGFLGYGVYTPDTEGERAPVLDLSILMRAAEWAAAIRDFRQRFDPARLAGLVSQEERDPRVLEIRELGTLSERRRRAGSQIRSVVGAAEAAGEAFAAGLPLEVGLAVARAGSQLEALDPEELAGVIPPPVARVVGELAGALRPLEPAFAAAERKATLRLDGAGIERELLLVRRWAEVGDPANGLEALRELMVNRVLLARLGMGATGWLDRELREAAERALSACRPAAGAAPRALSPAERAIGELWDAVGRDRNGVAHAGMCPDRVNPEAVARRLQQRHVPEFERLHREAGDAWRLAGLEELPEGEEA